MTEGWTPEKEPRNDDVSTETKKEDASKEPEEKEPEDKVFVIFGTSKYVLTCS